MPTNATPSKVFSAIRIGMATVLGLGALVAVSVYALAPEVLEAIGARAGFRHPAPARAQVEDEGLAEPMENEVAAAERHLGSAGHARR